MMMMMMMMMIVTRVAMFVAVVNIIIVHCCVQINHCDVPILQELCTVHDFKAHNKIHNQALTQLVNIYHSRLTHLMYFFHCLIALLGICSGLPSHGAWSFCSKSRIP